MTATHDRTCGWCDNTTPDHQHRAVVVRDLGGNLLGRLTPDGTTTTRRIYAAVLSTARSGAIADDINRGGRYRAHTIPF